MKWSTNDIPDLSGKIALVTGANSGIGFETAKSLAKHHCQVVMACRDLKKGNQAKEEIIRQVPQAILQVLQLDLSDLESVKTFCNEFKSQYTHLDILINNAGIANIPNGKTKDGFEIIMGTNYLGPFALTAQLYPWLLKAVKDRPRIVTVGSQVHKYGVSDNDSFYAKSSYPRLKAYANSKLADMLFAFELERRLKANHINLISVVAHPGFAATQISDSRGAKANNVFTQWFVNILNKLLAQSPVQGALTILRAATDKEVQGGEYYGPDGFGGWKGNPELIRAAAMAYDEKKASALWDFSERVTQIPFPIVKLSQDG